MLSCFFMRKITLACFGQKKVSFHIDNKAVCDGAIKISSILMTEERIPAEIKNEKIIVRIKFLLTWMK